MLRARILLRLKNYFSTIDNEFDAEYFSLEHELQIPHRFELL
jgi:hypothetical protein